MYTHLLTSIVLKNYYTSMAIVSSDWFFYKTYLLTQIEWKKEYMVLFL